MNVVQIRPAIPEQETPAGINPRQPYSFDMTQPDPKGFVLIDACVPLSLAVEFMNLITEYSVTV